MKQSTPRCSCVSCQRGKEELLLLLIQELSEMEQANAPKSAEYVLWAIRELKV